MLYVVAHGTTDTAPLPAAGIQLCDQCVDPLVRRVFRARWNTAINHTSEFYVYGLYGDGHPVAFSVVG